MPEVLLIGDIHCRSYRKIMEPYSIQLGDLCLRGYKDYQFEDAPRYFVDGNHDRFPELNPDAEKPYEVVKNLFHIPRGYVSGTTLFIGGADCVPWDRAARLPGRDWFPEETISQQQLNRILDKVKNMEITHVVSHDIPKFAVQKIMRIAMKNGPFILYTMPSNIALEAIFKAVKPKHWIFGHYHETATFQDRGCTFTCFGEGVAKKFNLPVGEDLVPFQGQEK